MQIKVIHTKMHKITINSGFSRHEHVPVAEAKLVLVPYKAGEGINKNYIILVGKDYYKPILVSETEKIEVGDHLFWNGTTKFVQKSEVEYTPNSTVLKVLALPEHFSPKHLQAIVDGKMKDGDKVLVECYHGEEIKIMETDKHGKAEQWQHLKATFVKLNSSNHITLHKVEEKMYTRSEVEEIVRLAWIEAAYTKVSTLQPSKDAKEWFEQNVK